MMFPSHLLGAACLGLGIGLLRGRPFSRQEWTLALAFGVLIDLDHLLAIPAYVSQVGVAAALDPTNSFSYGAAWQGFMHKPAALALVAPAMLLWRSAWPGVFWGLHMVQDFVIARHYVGFGSVEEFAIMGGLGLLAYGLHRIQRARSRVSVDVAQPDPASL